LIGRTASLDSDDQWNMVASDTTQDQAVALARTGKSFIIQGPPGTGKSQTITNLIADFVAKGKRVLFVCEKRAALDVVFNRLNQASLGGLATLIHDSQEDKKSFIMDLKDRYEVWIKIAPQLENFQSERAHIISACHHNFNPILQFDAVMSSRPNDNGQSIRQLITRQASLSLTNTEVGPETREKLPSPFEWDQNQSLIRQSMLTLKELFGSNSLAELPHARLSRSTIEAEDSFAQTKSFVELAEPLSDDISAIFEALDIADADKISVTGAQKLSSIANRMEETNLSDNLPLLDEQSKLSQVAKKHAADIQTLEKALQGAETTAEGWHNRLSYEDTQSALAVAEKHETSFWRFLKGQWRTLKKTVNNSYDFKAHAIRPDYQSVLEKLNAVYFAETAIAEKDSELEELFGTKKPSELLKLRDEVVKSSLDDRLMSHLIQMNADTLRQHISQLASIDSKMVRFVELLQQYFDNVGDHSISEASETIRDIRENLDDLPTIIPLLQQSYKADQKTGYILRHVKLDAPSLEALIVDEAITTHIRQEPDLLSFNIQKLSDCSLRSAKAQELLLHKNAENIVAAVHHNFLQHVRHSTLSVSGMDQQGKAFKKMYANGRRELEHEFGKSMRYKSIREVSSGDTGVVVGDIKPIWLMSPLSVSDTLPLKTDLFDVVIFDEASQIPVEDGIPALCRAPQLIVVGDEMQLPPTSFFSSSTDDEDIELEVQENGERFNIALDADSLLTQAAKHLPATLLAWHYRSRSEALISFSNAAFYNGNLVTIPDQKMTSKLKLGPPIKSDAEHSGKVACENLLAAPLSFHIVEDGVYESRANRAEAKLIASMVQELLANEVGKSIGIVAFSEAQQSCIETALEELASEYSDFATRLDEEFNREEDGEFTGLFVKNLENVQGDERDIIILSICYAPGPSGKMVMNFGPINQRGGEKRLNVIFSRAKQNMAVVTTIRSDAITNTHNDGANALRTFLAFAEARANGDTDRGRAALTSINTDIQEVFSAAPPVDPVREAISTVLREKGMLVEEYVGSAGFRCDLAIVDKDQPQYRLAILLDSGLANDQSGSYERFVFKPNILRAFGWRVVDVTRHSWRENPDSVIDYILNAKIRIFRNSILNKVSQISFGG